MPEFTRVLYINNVRHNVTHIGTRFWADSESLPLRRCSQHSLQAASVVHIEAGGRVLTSGNWYSLYRTKGNEDGTT